MKQLRSNALRQKMLHVVVGVVAGVLSLGVIGCSSEGRTGSVSSVQAMAEATVVWRADLRQGTTAQVAVALTRRFIEYGGVAATRGDNGQHLWVYSTSQPTVEQIAAISRGLSRTLRVDSVHRLR